MKLEIVVRSPKLSATIDSNEAHIRLLFGTWLAAKMCPWFVIPGFISSVTAIILLIHKISDKSSSGVQELLFSYSIWLLLSITLFIGSKLAIWRIQNLFHYRRVRELFDVVACYHLAREGFDAAGRPRNEDREIKKTKKTSKKTAK